MTGLFDNKKSQIVFLSNKKQKRTEQEKNDRMLSKVGGQTQYLYMIISLQYMARLAIRFYCLG